MTDKQKVDHWIRQIDRYLEENKTPVLSDVLKGIRKTIEETGRVTQKQARAIMSIRNGKND